MRQGWSILALEHGDYQSPQCVFERKDIGDFVNSIFARYGNTPRLFDQMDRLFDYCQRSEKIPFLVVTGKVETLEKQFDERGQKLNYLSLAGAIASVVVRYDCNIIWSEQPFSEVLKIMRGVAEKIEEGKLLLPMRKKLKEFSHSRSIAVVCSALQVSPKLAEALVKKFGGLYGILEAIKHHPSDVLVMDGIGHATFNKMKTLGGVT